MNFHYARYENVKKSVPPKFKNEASDHLKDIKYGSAIPKNLGVAVKAISSLGVSSP